MTDPLSVYQVSQWYDLVVFTASMEIYGAAVADKLDNSRGVLKKRFYRQVSCCSMFSTLHCVVGQGRSGEGNEIMCSNLANTVNR